MTQQDQKRLPKAEGLPGGTPTSLRSVQFRKERESSWRELEQLLARAESEGLGSLRAEEIVRLVELYRSTGSALSVARSISLDKNALAYLEGLSQRAYLVVYSPRRRFLGAILTFFRTTFPRLVRDLRYPLLVTAVVFLGGVLAGERLVRNEPDRFYGLVSSEMAGSRGPHSTAAELLEVLEQKNEETGALSLFASMLLSHNAQIGLLSFGLGFLGGLPALILVLVNGLVLGAFVAIHETAGIGTEFWAWVLPHGVTELFAMCLCAAAGLRVGQSFLFPGPYRRWEILARNGRGAATAVVGSVALFAIAATIEGFFRQLVTSIPIRLGLASVTAILLLIYFTRIGREEES